MIENETREYKKSLAQLKEGIISLTAILNKHGKGELWFGIRNDGTPLGLNITDKTIRDISQAIAAHVEPKIYPSITVEPYGPQSVQCIKVHFSGADTPYYAYGRAYLRVADEDRQISAKELESLILNKYHDILQWDNKPSVIALPELNEEKIKIFVEKAGLPWDTATNALDKLGLLYGGKPVHAATVFFGKDLIHLRCAVFASTTSATIIDQHDYTGDILTLIDDAQKYILKNIHIGMRLDGLYRVDVPEISVAALREAVINAFCHRDYRNPDEVRVAIFKDRVEIRNPGILFGGLTIGELRTGNISKRRNPLIAELLRRIHMVEGWGRGIPLILENEPRVIFKEIAQIFITSFGRPSFEKESAEISATDTNTSTENSTNISGNDEIAKKTSIVSLTQKISATGTNTSTENGTDTSGDDEISKKISIIALIQEEPSITLAEIASKLGLSKAGVRYYTDRLQAQGVLKRHGRKNGFWETLGTIEQPRF